MKKLIILVTALTLSIGAYAQDKKMKMDKMDQKEGSKKKMDMDKMDDSKKEYVMMHDGKLMMMKGGKSSDMTMDMTMKNGNMIMKDGTLMIKGGSNRPLKEGEAIYMDGSIKMIDMKDHN